ncbi:MAG: SDR family oxidoreductase [Gammaproteobacteria bacterium]|nr:SDR family oxidoreductase [Gammaproteobacteria bacterium]
MNKNIMIIGATSAIAQEVARQYASPGCQLFLVARDESKLDIVKADLLSRGAGNVATACMDFSVASDFNTVLDNANAFLGSIDTVLIAYGTLPDQVACAESSDETLKALNLNLVSVISVLTVLGNYFEKQQSGTIAVISSVAGDRGRQSNYVYGAAKGGLSIFLQGLRNRLATKGVNVLTIKPGFVDTPMTKAFDKGPLWASPKTVAKSIVKAIEKNKDTLYVPWFWFWIMLIIKFIPEKIFKRMSL